MTPVPLVYIASQFEKAIGNISYAANGFRAISGLNAFRSYQWTTDTRLFNESGNFRGMVTSSRWATTYEVISPSVKLIGNIATVAAVAANAINMAPQFEAVYSSNENVQTKNLLFANLAGIVAQKTLAGIVVGGVHLIYLPLLLSCNALAAAGNGGSDLELAQICSVVSNADALVKTSSDYITDPINQQRVIQNLVSITIN